MNNNIDPLYTENTWVNYAPKTAYDYKCSNAGAAWPGPVNENMITEKMPFNLRGIMIFKVDVSDTVNKEQENAKVQQFKDEHASVIEKLISDQIECVFMKSDEADVEFIRLDSI